MPHAVIEDQDQRRLVMIYMIAVMSFFIGSFCGVALMCLMMAARTDDFCDGETRDFHGD